MMLLKNIFFGAIVGIANIIPGVSGGTMALVLGFYERLIDAIHSISGETLKAVLGIFRFNRSGFEGFQSELKRIDAGFLMAITAGALVSIVALARLMTYLLTEWHDPTYGFFFGLVLVSALVPYRIIKKKTLPVLLSCVLAVAGVFAVSVSITDEKKIEKARIKHELSIQKESSREGKVLKKGEYAVERLLYLFLLGAIAISAMILPGISGSLLLLLMGGYFDILSAIDNRDLLVIAVFAAGCLAGILLFTRLLNFLLKRWSDETMSALLGLVVGSLWMIWPFRNTRDVGGKVVYLSNRVPADFGFNELLTMVSVLAGMVIVALFIRMEASGHKEQEA